VTLCHALLEGGDDLFVRDLLAFEVALHQLVRVLGDLVHQLLSVLLGQVLELFGNLALARVAAVLPLVRERLHVDQVDHAAHVLLRSDRDLGRDDVDSESRFEGLQGLEEVSPLAVEHVDEDQARETLGGCSLPQPLGMYFDAVHRVHDDDRRIHNPEGRQSVGNEAGIAWGVDQVDLSIVEVDRGNRSVDRHLALLLVGLVIADGRALDDRAEPVDLSRLEQDRLGEAGLAAASMPHEGNVSDPVGSAVAHAPGI
jgi:hypothetical protein